MAAPDQHGRGARPVIPAAAVTAWSVGAPWSTRTQVEQDLLFSRLICEIANHPYLGEELIFRGGTCFHKLRIHPARRYQRAALDVLPDEEPDLARDRAHPARESHPHRRRLLGLWHVEEEPVERLAGRHPSTRRAGTSPGPGGLGKCEVAAQMPGCGSADASTVVCIGPSDIGPSGRRGPPSCPGTRWVRGQGRGWAIAMSRSGGTPSGCTGDREAWPTTGGRGQEPQRGPLGC